MPQGTNHTHFVLAGIDVDDDLDMILVNDPILPPLHAANKNKNSNAISNRKNGDSSPYSESAIIRSTAVSQKVSSINPNDDEIAQSSMPNSSAGSTSAVVVTPPNAKNGTTTAEPAPPPRGLDEETEATTTKMDSRKDTTTTTLPYNTIPSSPSFRAKSAAAAKLRRSSESDGDDENYEDIEDEDDISDGEDDDISDDDDSDIENGSCFEGGSLDGSTQKQNFATVTNSRPPRRAKSAAVQKLAAGCDNASDGSEEEEDDTDELEGEDNYKEGVDDEEHNHEIDPREAPEAVQESPNPKKKLLLEMEEDSYDLIGEEKDSKKPAAKPNEDSDADASDDDEAKGEDGPAAPNGTKKRKKAPENFISKCDGEEDDDDDEAKDFIYSTKSKKQKKTIQTKTSVKEERDDDSTSRESNKKIKTSSKAVAVKKEASVKEEGGDGNGTPKKKPKKPRVSELVVNDAAEKMLVVLIQNYKDEIKQVPMDILAASITSKKGKPYTNHRSDAICEGLKLLQAQNKAKKIKHGKVGAARLLPPEIDKIPKEEISKDPVKVLEQRFQQFLGRLAKHKRGGTGEMVVKAAKAVWKKLQDGKAYSRRELVATTSYKGTNSSGFEGIMKVLGQLNFIEGKGKSSFTDKVFPHGRP